MEEYSPVMESTSYLPVINEPTRVTENTSTLLDHIWTNQLHEVVSGVIEISITDHFPIFLSTYLDISLTTAPIKKVFRDHLELSIINFKNDIKNYLHSFTMTAGLDVQSRTSHSHNKLYVYEIYDKHCKLKTKYIAKSSLLKPWITNEVKARINHKHLLF